MSLLYKEDWDKTKDNYKAWWNGEYTGRCLISAKAPKSGVNLKRPAFPEKPEGRFLDFDYLHELNEYQMKSTFYGGEAFPFWYPAFPGYIQMSAYIGDGSQIHINKDSAWRYPLIDKDSLEDYNVSQLKANPDNKWLKLAYDMQKFVMDETKGKSIPPMMTSINPGDDLADIRGAENLLYDVIDTPDLVKTFNEFLIDESTVIHDRFYDVIKQGEEGYSTWFDLWCDGKHGVLQCDFSYMISPKAFQDIFIPGIEKCSNYFDHSVYHVDGEGSFNHVDALCDLPRLQTLQILPGDGKPSPLHYIDVLRKVQLSGKNLHISIAPEEIETALELLSAKGLFINTHFETEEHAKYVLSNLEKWSKIR